MIADICRWSNQPGSTFHETASKMKNYNIYFVVPNNKEK